MTGGSRYQRPSVVGVALETTCELPMLCSVVKGDCVEAVDNELVGRFEVSGLAALPSGINVTFAVNASGIIEVRPCHQPQDMHIHDNEYFLFS
jgi:molecular chaperone DnaK (HSP70)